MNTATREDLHKMSDLELAARLTAACEMGYALGKTLLTIASEGHWQDASLPLGTQLVVNLLVEEREICLNAAKDVYREKFYRADQALMSPTVNAATMGREFGLW